MSNNPKYQDLKILIIEHTILIIEHTILIIEHTT